jgi:S1-C subfamily serine protease
LPVPEEHQPDLDLLEIADLNLAGLDDYPAEEETGGQSWVFVPVLLLILIAFLGWTFSSLGNFSSPPDLSFLQQSFRLSQDEQLQEYSKAVVTIKTANASGSGFNIDPQGLIVTNRHVIENAKTISVYFPSGQIFSGHDLLWADDVDLAVFKINGENLPALALASSLPQTDEQIWAIGAPLGFSWSFTTGQVLSSPTPLSPLIYLELPVRSGSSGSPVLNNKGEVLAVIFAHLQQEPDIGLAIPISYLQELLE